MRLLLLLLITLPAPAFALGTLPIQRLWMATAMLLAYGLLCVGVWQRHRQQARARQQAAQAMLHSADGALPVLLAYASQTGQAEQLALQTAHSLQQAGIAVRLLPLAQVDQHILQASRQALFVVSTTGEGDAPDNALAFVRQVMPHSPSLAKLHYGLLALGDRDYQLFCAFGRELDIWLRLHGAQPLFNSVEVNQSDAAALDLWNLHLSDSFNTDAAITVEERLWQQLQLLARHCLNPDSQGLPTFSLELGGPGLAELHWVSGDILEILPRQTDAHTEQCLQQLPWPGDHMVSHDGHTRRLKEWLSRSHPPQLSPLPASAEHLVSTLTPLSRREYSIASLPSEGKLALLVRQARTPQGELGLGSGWLTHGQQPGEYLEARLRPNLGFHLAEDDRPLILIANGTGIAGLRSHLQQRIQNGHTRNWLLFGERQAAHDFYYAEEIRRWQQQGFIERLDLTFSRDGGPQRYVQHALQEATPTLQDWLAQGASIYVCGSLEGMAAGVDSVLRNLLGDEGLEKLVAEKRYCRDVY